MILANYCVNLEKGKTCEDLCNWKWVYKNNFFFTVICCYIKDDTYITDEMSGYELSN